MTNEPQVISSVKKNERLKWIASLLLAIVVACSGCSFFLTVGLVARGELSARVLNADVRVWAINARRETGLGFDRAFGIQREDRSCTQHYTTIVLWKPALAIDSVAYDDCS
jgi:hypothetical protein